MHSVWPRLGRVCGQLSVRIPSADWDRNELKCSMSDADALGFTDADADLVIAQTN